MGEYSRVVNYDLKGPHSYELEEFLDSDNDCPLDLVRYPYDDGENVVLNLNDDYIKLFEIDHMSAIVVLLLELGRLGITGYILTLDNWNELTRYDIHAYGVDESWINIDDIEYPSSRMYPVRSSNSCEDVL